MKVPNTTGASDAVAPTPDVVADESVEAALGCREA